MENSIKSNILSGHNAVHKRAPSEVGPYMTCQFCNLVSFFDISSMHSEAILKRHFLAEAMVIMPESVQACKRCGRADHFYMGVHDFADLIIQRERLEKERVALEIKSSQIIIHAYRNYLKRMYCYAFLTAFIAYKKLRHRATIKITSLARGRLARRIANTKRNLIVIKDAHPILLHHALQARPNIHREACFWYNRQLEIDMLFNDYVMLCERMGFQPPRMVVEMNIKEISHRIIQRSNTLIRLVQRIWRGFMARRVVKYFKREIFRVLQMQIARILKIQRIYRGHYARLTVLKKYREEAVREGVMTAYIEGREKASRAVSKQRQKDVLMHKYRLEVAEEKCARFTDRIERSSTVSKGSMDRGKLAAFAGSCYGNEEVTQATRVAWSNEVVDKVMDDEVVSSEKARKVFINARIAEHGPEGYGDRGFNASRGRSMKIYFQAEIDVLTGNITSRAAKDFTRKNLLGRFSEYNKEIRTGRAKEMEKDKESVAPVVSSSIGHCHHHHHKHRSKYVGKGKYSNNFFKAYKFPEGVNDDPMASLNEDSNNIL